MSLTKETINNLLEIGLNNYEAKVYLTLIEDGTSSAKSISDITGIPYGKMYEIMTSLCSKGFAITLPTKPMKCKALPPEEVLKSIKKKQLNRFEALGKVFNEDLTPLYMQNNNSSDPKGTFWIINGRANINKKMEVLIKKAQKSICLFTSENGLKRLAFQKNLLKEAHDKGVSIRIASKKTKGNAEDCELLSFCEISNSKLSNTNNFISIDGEEAIVSEPLPDDDNWMRGRDTGMWVESKSFTQFLENLMQSQFPKNNNRKKNGF